MLHKLRALAVAACILLVSQFELPAQAQYTPEHPTVKKMVDAGIKFLVETNKTDISYRTSEPIMVGYTILKATGDSDHPLVKKGIESARGVASSCNRVQHGHDSKIVYEVSMAAVFLASVDATAYRSELMEVLQFFQYNQKPHGGFGYLEKSTGDTSQVQYVMLALWTMKEVGIEVPPSIVEGAVRYLKATMDPSGSWGYQGKIGNGRLVAQPKVSKSLGTAGVGALIIAGDTLSFYGERKAKKDEDDPVPEAFVRIDLKQRERLKNREITMTRADTDAAITRAIAYQQKSSFAGQYWYYYWRYSQERYESFVEIVNGRQVKSPAWYNQGVEELARFQDGDGGWGQMKKSAPSRGVCTSLAILFLIRSTQKAIGKLEEGLTFGGYELPSDISTVKMMGNRIVSDQETSVENLIGMLESESSVQVSLVPKNLALSDDPEKRKQQIARLSRLLDSKDFAARQVAARLLGRSENLDVVPDLIFALSDPDPEVPQIAEEGLRLLSRRLNAGKLKSNPSNPQREAAIDYWKKWYLGLRPDYIFLD